MVSTNENKNIKTRIRAETRNMDSARSLCGNCINLHVYSVTVVCSYIKRGIKLMADICDTTDEMNEIALAAAINNARKVQPHLIANGFCYNCREELQHPNALFCDSDCATDFEKSKRNVKL